MLGLHPVAPYLDIPMSISRLRLLMRFWMGSHSLPVEQGRLARPMVPPQLRRCTLCSTHAIGDERHYVFDCLHFSHIRRQVRSCSRMLMVPCGRLCGNGTRMPFSLWQMTQAWTCPHKPKLAEWTSLILCLSLSSQAVTPEIPVQYLLIWKALPETP